MIEDCPGCAGRGWIHDARDDSARECEICDGRGIIDTKPDDPSTVREPDSLGGSSPDQMGAPGSIHRILCSE